ncbi:MAG: bifunctional hydroxymethylpyrimidine kinase/phosphomethylpyrimidine kinase [Actinobacteria bacterium]|nr:bifunctional hydroxymethylpyrimidine kinase/phosphomethylpyrimidine kinase [Actinomycetota bacterium]
MSRTPKVTVVGGAGVGLVFDVDRSPEAGESVLANGVIVMSGGKAANQAIGAAFLGASTAFVSAVGDDPFRPTALERLTEHGVDISHVITKADHGTMLGAVIVDRAADNRIVIAPNVLAALSEEDIESVEPVIARADVCLVGLEIPVEPATAALRIARRHGVRTILNPAPSPPRESVPDLLALSDIVTPNLPEARAMTRATTSSAEAYASALLAGGAGTAVITLGAEGVLVHGEGTTTRVEAPTVDHVLDTSGAGDAFNAAFAVALAAGDDLIQACSVGCDAGSRIVQGPGFVDALDTWQELHGRYADEPRDPATS